MILVFQINFSKFFFLWNFLLVHFVLSSSRFLFFGSLPSSAYPTLDLSLNLIAGCKFFCLLINLQPYFKFLICLLTPDHLHQIPFIHKCTLDIVYDIPNIAASSKLISTYNFCHTFSWFHNYKGDRGEGAGFLYLVLFCNKVAITSSLVESSDVVVESNSESTSSE